MSLYTDELKSPDQVSIDPAAVAAIARIVTRCNVLSPKGCWIWMGSAAKGYGTMSYKNRQWRVSRLVYTLLKGDIPSGHHVLHSCDDGLCVNPTHLRSGTVLENRAEADERGRSVRGSRSHLAKVGENDVAEIRRMRLTGKTLREIGSFYGLSEATISRICQGRKWKHVAGSAAPIPTPVRLAATHCSNGHEYTPDNTYIYGTIRYCRECRRVQDKKRTRY